MSILNVCDVVVVVDSKYGVYKLVSLNQSRVTLILGRKVRSSAGKTQRGSSRLHVWISPTIMCFHRHQTSSEVIFEYAYLSKSREEAHNMCLQCVSVVIPDIVDRMISSSRAHLQEGPLLKLGICLMRHRSRSLSSSWREASVLPWRNHLVHPGCQRP